MSDITQDMKRKQSLMKYAEKYRVSRASQKYDKGRSYIYCWKTGWDGTVESLACENRRPHSHPNQHTEEELKLIRDMSRRNPTLSSRTLVPVMQTRLHPAARIPFPRHETSGTAAGSQAEKGLCSQTS